MELNEPQPKSRTVGKSLAISIETSFDGDKGWSVEMKCTPMIPIMKVADLLSAISDQIRTGAHGDVKIIPISPTEEP